MLRVTSYELRKYMNYLWKIGGEAGFGIMTTGLSFSKIATRSGYHIFDYSEYPSLIRGGHNTYEVNVSDEEVHSPKWEIDFLVCLNEETYLLHKNRLNKNSFVIYDPLVFKPQGEFKIIEVPFKSIIQKEKVMGIMINTIALGASIALLGGDSSVLYGIISEQFAKKGEEVVEFNKKFAVEGYNYVKSNYPSLIVNSLVKRDDKEKVVVTANESFSLSSVAADCRFFAAYPMTPTSSVLSQLAAWQKKSEMVVRHAEDEIAVINTAIGTSFAGVRSAVSTSGGGFALMVETLSLSGVIETPIVVFLGQRPGPATGMPTWTEQGDLLFAVNAGHGEFPKIVLAPGDALEMAELTMEAFDLADIYQTPVIIMGDKLICESHKSEYKETIEKIYDSWKINKGKTIETYSGEKYLRYQVTEDGISPRLIPGFKDTYYQANSYEHLEDGHTTEEAGERIKQVDKRSKKIQTYLTNHFQLPKLYGDFEQSKICFVSWGGNKGSILDSLKLLEGKGIGACYLHFTHVHPLDNEKIKTFFRNEKRYILVENNSQGQFGKLLRMETGIEIKDKILKYDGRPFYPEEIISKLTQLT